MRRCLTAVASILLVVLALPACSSLPGQGGGDSYRVTVFFDRAVSLYESSEIRILGLPAGKVTEVETVGDKVRVELAVDGDVPVPDDAVAAIVPQSLIGERYVQLLPAWTEGDDRLQDGDVIPNDRTIVPVEPDEALAALKEFLETLDPNGVGRLIENAADDLEGNGEQLGRALGGLSDLVDTFADKDDTLVRIMEQLDEFSATLLTREQQLGEVMDLFAETTSLLAQERRSIESLVANLASVSTDGLDIVSENTARIERALDVLGRLLRSVTANLDAVDDLLRSGPILVAGIDNAFNPEFRRLELRNQTSPIINDAVSGALEPLGIDVGSICLPIDVACEPTAPTPPGPPVPADAGVRAQSSGPRATPAGVAPSRTPVDDVLGLLGPLRLDGGVPVEVPPSPSFAEQVSDAAGGTGRFLRDAAASMLGALR